MCLLTNQSLLPTPTSSQEVRLPRPYNTPAAAEDTADTARLPDIYHQPSSARLLQTSPTRRPSQTTLHNLHCSHLDAMRSAPRDFLESRAYSTLIPCYSREHQNSCYASLAAADKERRGVAVAAPSRESVTWALEGPTTSGVGGRYFSLNRLRQDPLYAQSLSISSQSSAGPSAVDGCLASSRFDDCQSTTSLHGSGFDSGHESRRRRGLGYAPAVADKLRSCSPKLAGIYRTTTKTQPSPAGGDQGFDCY